MKDYIYTLDKIPFAELFGSALEPFGIREQRSPKTTDDTRCLVDATGLLWAEGIPTDSLLALRPSLGDSLAIVRAIETVFETDAYFGAEAYDFSDSCREGTADTWEALLMRQAETRSASFCQEIVNFVHDQSRGFSPLKLRMQLVSRIGSAPPSKAGAPFPDEAIRLVLEAAAQVPDREGCEWNPREMDGKVVRLGWIRRELENDRFLLAWQKDGGEAQRKLREWGHAADRRFEAVAANWQRVGVEPVQRHFRRKGADLESGV